MTIITPSEESPVSKDTSEPAGPDQSVDGRDASCSSPGVNSERTTGSSDDKISPPSEVCFNSPVVSTFSSTRIQSPEDIPNAVSCSSSYPDGSTSEQAETPQSSDTGGNNVEGAVSASGPPFESEAAPPSNLSSAAVQDDGGGDASSSEEEEDADVAAKRQEVLTALASEPPDLAALQQLARSAGGLLEDGLRRRAWPVLLQLRLDAAPPPESPQEELSAHPYHSQVVMDVERTLKRFPPGIDDVRRMGLQGDLISLIVRSLQANPHLHYYQGYHDVAITVLLVCGEELALPVLSHLAANHLSVFMAKSMEETQDLLTYMLPILESSDPPVCEFLVRSEAMATFALPWLITWFSHVLPHYAVITRLFDYVLATSWLAPVYLSAALVLARRDELLAGDCDLAAVHSLLSTIPPHLPWEGLLARATHLLAEQPPESLKPRVDALNRARRRAEAEERARLLARRAAREQRRPAPSAPGGGPGTVWWMDPRRWTVVGITVSVAVLAATIHYWRSHAD